MKYKLSAFIYGMGTAIVVLSLVYYVVYNLDIRHRIIPVDLNPNSLLVPDTTQLSDAEIEDLARGIGMVFPSELNSNP